MDKRIAGYLIKAGASPAEQSANRFESAVPILNVKNVPASIAYYVEKLGSSRNGLGLATWLRLHLSRRGPDLPVPGRARCARLWYRSSSMMSMPP